MTGESGRTDAGRPPQPSSLDDWGEYETTVPRRQARRRTPRLASCMRKLVRRPEPQEPWPHGIPAATERQVEVLALPSLIERFLRR
jgi:hypothetical protein